MKYTTYLFDFDYTLADSSRGIVICFRNVLERHGHTGISDEAIKRTIGKTLEDSFSILSGITTPETLAEYKKEYVKEADTYMTVNTFFFPETLTVLKTLKSQGAQIGIISTKFRFRIREMVDQHFPKDFFDIIIGGEDVKQAKPDPQGIKKALRRLHRRKSETLYIGDSTVDAETAQAAKVDFVGVLNGMTTREELMVYPHRQILDNLSLLPLIHKFTPYEPDKHFPEKFFYSSCFPQKIVAFYKLLHQKQIRGKHEIKENPTCCVCKNCGNTFQGNYCPHCGQNRHTPRFTIRNAFQNILSGFFNIDHGFSRNLIELLYRPGYMIRDYLKGKRVHYYKPFQTLFVLAALYIMGVQLIDPAAIKLSEKEMEEEPTIASLMDDIKYQQEQTSDSCTKYYLGQSITYADSAQWAQTHSLSESIQAQIDAKFSNQDPNELKKEISKQIKKELKQKIKAKNGEIDDWRGLMKEIGTTLARQEYAQLSEMPEVKHFNNEEKLVDLWNRFMNLRSGVFKALEEARNEKLIGKSFEAHVDLYVSNGVQADLDALNANVRQALIVSALDVHPLSEAPENALKFNDEYAVVVEHAEGEVCPRCRMIKTDIGSDADLPTLCASCAEIVRENYPEALAEGLE